jgi:hypothetical protein
MVIVKECYAQCNEAKTQLTQDLVSLQREYSNLMSSTSIVSNSIIHLLKLYFFFNFFVETFMYEDNRDVFLFTSYVDMNPFRSRGSSVSIVSGYGLDDQGSIPDRGRGFFF